MNMTCNVSGCGVLVLLGEETTLYMRPAAMLTKIANQFESDIIFEYGKERADGKSLMDIISLGISTGGSFTVFSYGKDAFKAINAVKDFLKSFFRDTKLNGKVVEEHAGFKGRLDNYIENKREAEMKLKKKSPVKVDRKKIGVFTWPLGENVKEVCLAGDFNSWKPEPMIKNGNGFTGTVKLDPGVYQYKFVVDGVWQIDPSAKEHIMNDLGSANSVLRI